MSVPAQLTGKRDRSDQPDPVGQPPANIRALTVGKKLITRAELRAGILNAETWPEVFLENNKTWLKLGGCPLGIGASRMPQCESATFNFYPTSKDAVIEYSVLNESDEGHVASSVAEGAEVEVAKMPFLGHSEMALRPTLVAFEVTGHVMLGVLIRTARGVEIHILNPWSMSESQQLKDVFTLTDLKLKTKARRVLIIDVAGEVEKYRESITGKPSEINLQKYEKLGFCTLWVGVIAGQLISQDLRNLQAAISGGTMVNSSLSKAALDFYQEAYTKLELKLYDTMLGIAKTTGEMSTCMPTAAAARAIYEMAHQAASAAGTGGKRKPRRQTKRRPLFRRRWTRKHRNPR